jgi:hemoglobin/transferrin/lactoferrin receptor protein
MALVQAQKNDSANVEMDALIISADRFTEKKKDISRQVEIIDQKTINFQNKQTTADLLQESGKILVQKSQQGGGSPVLRGFEANKVLLVLDGIRLNNAIYRSGHLQNILRIDQHNLERVEVLFGPSSLMYGSDALGGVVNFVSRKPQIDGGLKGYFNTRISSVNNELSNSLGIGYSYKKIAFFASYSQSKFGDLKQGKANGGDVNTTKLWYRYKYQARLNQQDVVLDNNDPSIQIGSAYTQENAMAKILFEPKVYQQHQVSFYYSKTSDVPRYDRLSEMKGNQPKFAEWNYGPEKFMLASYQFDDGKVRKWSDQIRLIGSVQQIEESRISRNFGDPNQSNRKENVGVYSLNLDIRKKIKIHEIRYGAEWVFNTVQSHAFIQQIDSNIQLPTSTRYPDGGSTMHWGGMYVSVNQELTKKWIISEGLRLNVSGLESKFSNKTFYPFLPNKINQTNTSLVGNLGIIRVLPKNSKVYLNIGNAFRAPNVDDVGKTFDSKSGEAVIMPNEQLKAEKTLNSELGIEVSVNSKLQLMANLFYTQIYDALVMQPSNINGQDSVVYEGKLTAVQMYQNASSGKVLGYYLGLSYKPAKAIKIESHLNYTYGRVEFNGEQPLDHIPPMFGRTAISYEYKRIKLNINSSYHGAKKLADYGNSGEDNLQYAGANGMPSWYTLNLSGGYSITASESVLVQTGIENILDRNYRVFASGISAAGRNFWISLKFKI